MGFIKRTLGLEPELIKLVRAHIMITADLRFYVDLEKRHPELKTPDLVRLLLHYYGKILFIFHDAEEDGFSGMTEALREMMDQVVSAEFDRDMSILALAGIEDEIQIIKKKPLVGENEISATLYSFDIKMRAIVTELSEEITGWTAVCSVFALLIAIIDEIDDLEMLVLLTALQRMHVEYDFEDESLTPVGLIRVPNIAYLDTLEALKNTLDEEEE